jgi:hypothetical protein
MLVAKREHRLLEGAALDLSEEGRNFLVGGQNGSGLGGLPAYVPASGGVRKFGVSAGGQRAVGMSGL